MDETAPTLIYLLACGWFFPCGCLFCAIGEGIEEE